MSFILEGSIVKDIKADKIGTVIVVDRNSKFVVVSNGKSYWTQWFRNLEVAPYKEVE